MSTPLEIVSGNVTVSAPETLVCTLTAWHPKVDVYVDPKANPLALGTMWRVYAITTGGVRTLLAEGAFTGDSLSEGQRVVSCDGGGDTIALYAQTDGQSTGSNLAAAMVGWDPNFQETPDVESQTATHALGFPAYTTFGTLSAWFPKVGVGVDASLGPAAIGESSWQVVATFPSIAGFADTVLASTLLQEVKQTLFPQGVFGGCEAWLLRARTQGEVATVKASILGYATGGEASGGGGSSIPNASWYVPHWYIDPVGGSDSNNGTTALTPLKTFLHLVSLWGTTAPFLYQSTIVEFLNDQPDFSDPVSISANILGAAGNLQLLGQLTELDTGSFTAVTPRDRATAQRWEGTDGGKPAGFWTPYVGMLVHDTTADAWFWVVQDLGASNAVLSEPMASAVGNATPAEMPIAPGDNYVIYSPTKVCVEAFQVQSLSGSASEIQHIRVTGPGFGDLETNGILLTESAVDIFWSMSVAAITNCANSYFLGIASLGGYFFGGVITFELATQEGFQTLLDGDILVQAPALGINSVLVVGAAYFANGLNIPNVNSSGGSWGELVVTNGAFYGVGSLWGPAGVVINPNGWVDYAPDESVFQNLGGVSTGGAQVVSTDLKGNAAITGFTGRGPISITASNNPDVGGSGGNIGLTAGSNVGTDGNGGSIVGFAGTAGANTGTGGSASLIAGDGPGAGQAGGDLNLTAGNANAGTGGAAHLTSGSGQAGGSVNVVGGSGTASTGGSAQVLGGASAGSIGGSASIISGDSGAAAAGDLTLALGTGVTPGNLQLANMNIAATATAGGAVLPVTPSGFWTVVLNGTTVEIPYYNP